MKQIFSLILTIALVMSLCACSGNAATADNNSVPVSPSAVPENTQNYTPGITVKTDFGHIAVLDAVFCNKAQLIDGLPSPAYNSSGDGRIVFAMRTQISNTSGKDLVLMDDLKVTIHYSADHTFVCSKGGNYKSSDPLYTILPAGSSGEYIICGRVPVDVYRSSSEFYVSFNGANLMFDSGKLSAYDVMGYRADDNTLTTIDAVIGSAGTAPAESSSSSSQTEVSANLSFALEDVRYGENGGSYIVELNIRNNSDASLVSAVFTGMILDANGDILENTSCLYPHGFEAGQAGWADIRINDASTRKNMASIKIVTLWYKDDPNSPSHNIRFDLPEPFVIPLPNH
ncbi:MAG: hypothetical protein J6V25_12830 [Oscillospiraceae bacterium]|nr:hypothetical protein [Oscillospiraceae bacterium]